MELCCGKILADDQDLDNFHIWLKKIYTGEKKKWGYKEPTSFLSMKQSNSREWAFRFDFKVCGPEAEFLPVQGAAWGWEAALKDEARGEESGNWTTEMVTDKQAPRWARPTQGEGWPAHRTGEKHRRKTHSLHCTHGAPGWVSSSWHGVLVVVYNICLHHPLWLFYFCFA